MNRLYAIECTPTITGASADHRLPLPARDVAAIARAIAGAVGIGGPHRARRDRTLPDRLAQHNGWIGAMARDLKAAGGKGLVIAGDPQPPEVHALAHLINHALGNVGKTVEFLPRVDEGPADQVGSLRELIRDIDAGAVDTLIILGRQPGLRRPGGSPLRQAAVRRQDQAADPPGPVRRRDRAALPLARPRGPRASRPGAICGPSTGRQRSSSP